MSLDPLALARGNGDRGHDSAAHFIDLPAARDDTPEWINMTK